MPLYLGDVFPDAALQYPADAGSAQAVLGGKRLLSDAAGRVAGTDGTDIVSGDLDVGASVRAAPILAIREAAPSRRFSHVVGMGAKMQVARLGADTGRIVAVVNYPQLKQGACQWSTH